MSKSLSGIARSLNRIVVACRDEAIVINSAAHTLSDAKRRAYLRQQTRRRRSFRRDLADRIIDLGGAPAARASFHVRLAGVLHRVWGFMAGAHPADTYAACARATSNTAHACAKALQLELPAGIRLDIARKYTEVETELKELRRLRWSASPTPRLRRNASAISKTAGRLRSDERALGAWDDDGGQVENRVLGSDLDASRPAAAPIGIA
jgi:uncharacterized protein (TIGR02284 family)